MNKRNAEGIHRMGTCDVAAVERQLGNTARRALRDADPFFMSATSCTVS